MTIGATTMITMYRSASFLSALTFTIIAFHLFAPLDVRADEAAGGYVLDDIAPNVTGLFNASEPLSFLVIRVAGTEDFLQLNNIYGALSLDFPIVTKRQKATKRKIKKTAKTTKLNCANDKSAVVEMIECEMPASAGEVSEVLFEFLEQVYGVTGDTPIEFEAGGFALTTAK